MKIDLILSLILSLVLIGSSESKHFCDRFRANKNRISYVFRRFFTPSPESYTKHNIIINGSYWTIEFTEQNDVKNLRFEDEQQITKSAPFFSGDYLGAACLWFGTEDNGKCVTTLFNKNNITQVVLGDIPNDDYRTERELTDYRQTKTVTVEGLAGLQPVFALTSVKEWFDSKVIFIEGSKSNGYVGKRYSFTGGSDSGLNASCDITMSDEIHKYSGPHLIFGLSPQHSFADKVDGLLVLLKDHENHHRLLWCWVAISAADCSAKELVDCSEHDKTHWSSQSLTIILIVFTTVFIAVVVLIMIAIVYYVLGKADREDAPNRRSDPYRANK